MNTSDRAAPPVGILMNRSAFPRLPGDIGNPKSFDFPVLYREVEGTTYQKVVEHLNEEELLAPFIAAAQELEAAGVGAITTSCGFLALFQQKLAAAVSVPVFTSSLMQIPMVASMLPPDRIVGVMTADSTRLTPAHLAAAGCGHLRLAIAGMEETEEFIGFLRENRPTVDAEKCRREHIAVAERLMWENPDIGAIVLECTNMPPWAKDIQKATGLPVFDVCTLTSYVAAAVMQKRYPAE